ncbi:hypothetical protein [Stenotrophomonas rhizophila]|uniref:hypothetical protein n=1 Tax=Stenotrophomonas rhizophila TaxID=216778 RepID=UPI001E51BEB8|nr:hypothetical protein [Stenotrophomonas rhizophila]MCC7634863.1 hypothetical protein [Stenotrophomonas rhizophila]MCC7664464.1 hypothetical protein [Stenotrophomonas rhizophila]
MKPRKLFKPSMLAGLLLGAAAVIATTAHAASMTPFNSPFIASGPTDLQAGPYGGPCTSTFYGAIDGAGNATIDGPMSEFVGSDLICTLIQGVGQWTLVPTSPNTAEIRDAEVAAPGLISCFGTVPGTLVDGVFTFDAVLDSDKGIPCKVSGTLKTSPPVGIQWP